MEQHEKILMNAKIFEIDDTETKNEGKSQEMKGENTY